MQRKKENRQKIKERWIPMENKYFEAFEIEKKSMVIDCKKNREIFRMQEMEEMGMILPAVLMKAWKILFQSSEESVKWDFLIW